MDANGPNGPVVSVWVRESMKSFPVVSVWSGGVGLVCGIKRGIEYDSRRTRFRIGGPMQKKCHLALASK